jgi:peptidoglycan-N-acetylmuramic acid deacetylase
MKKLLSIAIVAVLCFGLTAASVFAENRETYDGGREPAVDDSGEPSAHDTLDTTSQGYGMGRQVDNENRPTGADEFNAQYSGYDAVAINEPDTGVTLTFDCGYENGNTAKILDTLKEKNVKAIFFVTGDYVQSEKALINRMIAEGHIIGNHGMKHKSLPVLSDDALNAEIMTLHDFVKNEFGYEMTYLRPPCGEFSEKSLSAVQDLGYKTLMWSFAYVDWEENSQPDSAAALERIVGAAHSGEIALLHAVSDTNTAILGQVIDEIRAKGLEFDNPGGVNMGYFEKFRNIKIN